MAVYQCTVCGYLYDDVGMAAPLEALEECPVCHRPRSVFREIPAFDASAMFKLSYGLFVLTARSNGRDNGCIINTVMQVADNPVRLALSVNKKNFTHDMLRETGVCNLSVLTEKTPMEVFRHFGFQSGRDTDKFAACDDVRRTANGVLYVPKYTNAVLSARVVEQVDCGSHTLFVATVDEALTLGAEPSVTYAYYFAHIKPKPAPEKKKGFVCKICGYIYEGDTLPADFICPVCKHGAEAFEPLK